MNILESYKPGAFLISTDLETDDLLAIYMLSKIIRKSKILFLVGEGNSNIKEIRMKSYVKTCGFTNAIVIRGYSSKKLFSYDGHDVMMPNEANDVLDEIKPNPLNMKVVINFIKESTPFIISLKPPRELIQMWDQGESEALSKCIFAGYMSFNMRCLMREWKYVKPIEFLNNFKQCYFYETHYAVDNNIITEKNFDFTILPCFVTKLMLLWNKFQVEDCVKTIMDLEGKTDDRSNARRHRNEKCVKQVKDNNGKQFVNADTGLIVSLIQKNAPYYYTSVHFNEKTGYSVIGKSFNMMYVIQPKDKQEYRKFQVMMIKTLCQ